MNDERLIWEAYTNKNKQNISPIKQILIDCLEGLWYMNHYYKAFEDFMNYDPYKARFGNTEPLTKEKIESAKKFVRDLVGMDFGDYVKRLKNRDDYVSSPLSVIEAKTENLLWDARERLQELKVPNEQIEEYIDILVTWGNGYNEAELQGGINNIMELDV